MKSRIAIFLIVLAVFASAAHAQSNCCEIQIQGPNISGVNLDKPTDAGKTAYDIFFMMLAPATTAAQGQTCPVPGRVQPLPTIVKR